MALRLALVFANKIHLNVRHVGSAAHEVVTNKAIEIVGRSNTGIDLIIGHLRLRSDCGSHLTCHGCGLFQRRTFGHVQDDLEFTLVIEGQHFHFHPSESNRRHGAQQQRGDHKEK